MTTQVICNKKDYAKKLGTVKILTLCSMILKDTGKRQIGFLTPDKETFILLCGGRTSQLSFNYTNNYDLSTHEDVEGTITVNLD